MTSVDWQPIETAPKDGTRVLLWTHDRVDIGCFDESKHYRNGKLAFHSARWVTSTSTATRCGADETPPTDWAPLPDGPENHPRRRRIDAKIAKLPVVDYSAKPF